MENFGTQNRNQDTSNTRTDLLAHQPRIFASDLLSSIMDARDLTKGVSLLH